MTLRQHKKRLISETEIGEKFIDFFVVEIFTKVPKVLRITQDDIGKRLWLAGEYRTKTIRLKDVKEGYLEITYQKDKKYRTVYPQEAVLHPDELTKERLEKHGFEIKDGRSNA